MQQAVLLPTCTVSFITNAGKARIRGGELEIAGTPFADVPLSVQFGLGYTDGVLRDPGLLAQAPSTSRLSQLPEWTGTISGYYEIPVTESVRLFAAADYSYTGSVSLADGRGGFIERQPFNLVNGNIGIRFRAVAACSTGKNPLDKRLNFGDQPASGSSARNFSTMGPTSDCRVRWSADPVNLACNIS